MKAIKMGGKFLGAVLAVIGLMALSTPARADVTVNPKVINFGTVAVGTRSTAASVTLTNNNSRRSVSISASTSPWQFTYNGSTSFTLKPLQKLTVGVSFRPTSAQAYTGALKFVTGSGTTLRVSLSGTGASAQPTTSTITLTVDPASISLAAGAKQTFIATTHGGNNTGITWTATCGSFTSDGWYGFYTAPSAAGSCTVTGRLTADPTVSVTSAVSVTGGAPAPTATMPAISSQPVSKTVSAGQTASFSVSVTGTAPFSYQWKKNGAAISGATSSSYTTAGATMSDNNAQFTCTVSNSVGNVTSSAATLTVNAATLLLSANPGSLSFGNVNVGSSASQQVTLTNSGTGNVTLSGMSFTGAGFSASGVSSGQILAPGQTATINVSFQPSATGSMTGSVSVASNASAPAVVTLSGSGVQTVSHLVSLSWTRSTSTVNGYMVYSSQVSGGPYTRLTASAINLSSFTDSSVQNGKTYYYVVTAVDASGVESGYSNQASAVIQ